MKINEEYRQVFNGDILKLEENNRILYIKNAKGLIKIKVDGGVLNGNELKCDYLVQIVNFDKKVIAEIFVELKGKNIPHAIIQLRNTIDLLSINKIKGKKMSYIISTKVNPAMRTQIQVAKLTFKKSYNSSLEIHNVKYSLVL